MNEHFAKEVVAKSFGDAAQSYDEFAKIQHRIAAQLLSQCPSDVKKSVLDLGCGTGYCLPVLEQRYSKAQITGADLSQGMLDFAQASFPKFQYTIADAENLPFENESFDLIFSNFAVQWCDDFSMVLSQAFNALKPGGHLLLSTLAGGTLAELKQAWASVDNLQHVNNFETAEDLEKYIDDSGFEVENISCHTELDFYDDIRGLTDSLKRIGAHNMTQGRSKALTSAGKVKAFKVAMEAYREDEGLPASYNVFTCLLRKN
jgi:malonyl-CoA O-methyltransferase